MHIRSRNTPSLVSVWFRRLHRVQHQWFGRTCMGGPASRVGPGGSEAASQAAAVWKVTPPMECDPPTRPHAAACVSSPAPSPPDTDVRADVHRRCPGLEPPTGGAPPDAPLPPFPACPLSFIPLVTLSSQGRIRDTAAVCFMQGAAWVVSISISNCC